MKNSWLKYILILSILLNISLLGAAGYTYYSQNRNQPLSCGYGESGLAPAGPSSAQPYLFEALSLKPEQRKLFEQKASQFHKALDEKREKVDRLRKSLFDLMQTADSDSAAIDMTISEINGVQEDIQKMVVAHMLQFKSMLDQDQQKKFFALIQGAMTNGREVPRP